MAKLFTQEERKSLYAAARLLDGKAEVLKALADSSDNYAAVADRIQALEAAASNVRYALSQTN